MNAGSPNWNLSFLAPLLLSLAFAPTMAPSSGPGGEKTVWQIGQFDESSGEFNDGTAPEGPIYRIERNKVNDWYAFQPGSANGRFGNKPHPRLIEFTLQEAPAGRYTVRIALLGEHAGVPALEVDINGKKGRYYQHPVLNYSMGDGAAAWFPTYSSSALSFSFPSDFLRVGLNQIVLTAIDEYSPGEASPDAPSWAGDSGVVYDAVSLTQVRSENYSRRAPTARIDPTIFYHSKNGKLHERIDVFVDYGRQPQKAEVRLSLNRATIARHLSADRDFGELRTSFEVPDFTGPQVAALTITSDGSSQSFDQEIRPARKWTLFVVPNEHLDVGYTDFAAKVAEVHSRVIDEAMQLIEKFPNFRFSLDGFWEVEQFEAARTADEKERLYQMVRDKRISVPPQYANLLTQFASSEALIRSLYAGTDFRRRHGGVSDYVSITDIPSFSWSYASLLAASGFTYFIAGSNNDASPILLFGRHHEHSPFWWEGPDGKRILMWYSRMYTQVASLFGMPPNDELGAQSLPIFLQIYDRPEYHYDAAILYGTQPENTDLFPQQASFVGEWNSKYAYPKLAYSSFPEALDRIVGASRSSLPVIRGDGGSFWESFNTADARYVAIERDNEARALSAEKISTLAALVDPRTVPNRADLKEIWKDILLMDEHTWNSSRSVSHPASKQTTEQQAEKESLSINAHHLINRVLERGMAALADQVSAPPRSLLVYNSLNWTRDGLVELDLDPGWQIFDAVTEQPVLYEVRSTTRCRRVRFLAVDVPAVGYRIYRLRKVSAHPTENQPIAAEFESPYYRVGLDSSTGAIRSIYDRQLQREMVDVSSPFRFGQYLYVTGADTLPNRLVAYRTTSPFPELSPHGSRNGRIVSLTRAPFGMVAQLESSAPNTPIVSTEIVLFDKQKKIQLTYRLEKPEVFRKEGIYFAFPIAVNEPRFQYEIQTTFVDPATDMMKGAGLETFSIQHWIRVYDAQSSAAIFPLDTPIMSLGDIVRGTFPTEFGRRSGSLFSFAMSNYHYDNWPGAQGGEFYFRYSFTSGTETAPASLTRLGWEDATPLEVNEITPQDKTVSASRQLPAALSFVKVSRPDVLLQTWKAAEDGNGTILRFLSFGDHANTVDVTIPLLALKSAWLCTALEDKSSPVPVKGLHTVSFEIHPHETLTLRLETTDSRE